MALKTTLATRYWLKTIVMALVCVVLGLWGIWDYVVAIPRDIEAYSRATFLREVIQPALDVEFGSQERDDATVVLNAALEEDDGLDPQWSDALVVFDGAVSGNNVDSQQKAKDLLETYLNKYGNVTQPSRFDRPMQWVFILCLPFGFYYFGAYLKMSNRAKKYLLDDDGTLTTPEGTWTAEEIEGIDMDRWISKTGKARTTWTAKVIVKGHAPVLLDDYVYKDMHLVIGKLAHKYYPKEWTPLAKRVIPRTEEDGEKE